MVSVNFSSWQLFLLVHLSEFLDSNEIAHPIFLEVFPPKSHFTTTVNMYYLAPWEHPTLSWQWSKYYVQQIHLQARLTWKLLHAAIFPIQKIHESDWKCVKPQGAHNMVLPDMEEIEET